MTGSNTERNASVTATHQSSPSSVGPDRKAIPAATAQPQATTIATTRAGPAATAPPCNGVASGSHSVGWLTCGQFGCLVTAV